MLLVVDQHDFVDCMQVSIMHFLHDMRRISLAMLNQDGERAVCKSDGASLLVVDVTSFRTAALRLLLPPPPPPLLLLLSPLPLLLPLMLWSVLVLLCC
jgi:hypothetical protein